MRMTFGWPTRRSDEGLQPPWCGDVALEAGAVGFRVDWNGWWAQLWRSAVGTSER